MKNLLDRHGYSFQLAVEQRISELSKQASIPWKVHTAEFPVAGKDWNTKIDLILEASLSYMVIECKRVDPAFAWFFAKGSPTLRGRVEIDEIVGDAERTNAGSISLEVSAGKPFHIGLVGKSGEKGDGTGAGRDQLETASTQVLRGASGLINFFAENYDPALRGAKRRIIPVIISTASLFVTEANLGTASLDDGLLPADVEVEEKWWLWYQYQRSPTIEHDLPSTRRHRDPRQANFSQYPRTIAVVKSEKLEHFLRESSNWL